MINMVKRTFLGKPLALEWEKFLSRDSLERPSQQLFSSSVVFQTLLHKREKPSGEEKIDLVLPRRD